MVRAFGNSTAKTLRKRRNMPVPMAQCVGHMGLNIFLRLPGSKEEQVTGMVLGTGLEGGFKWTHTGLACSAVESKQSEIAGAQELACAVSCHPLNREGLLYRQMFS